MKFVNFIIKDVDRFGDGREESITDDDFVDSFLEYVLELIIIIITIYIAQINIYI